MNKTVHQGHKQSWMDIHCQLAAQEDSDMSQSTLTEQDDLDLLDTQNHDKSLNGPFTFCKEPSDASRVTIKFER